MSQPQLSFQALPCIQWLSCSSSLAGSLCLSTVPSFQMKSVDFNNPSTSSMLQRQIRTFYWGCQCKVFKLVFASLFAVSSFIVHLLFSDVCTFICLLHKPLLQDLFLADVPLYGFSFSLDFICQVSHLTCTIGLPPNFLSKHRYLGRLLELFPVPVTQH